MNQVLRSLAAAVAAISTVCAPAAAATFLPIGPALPGATRYSPKGLSADGTVAVGYGNGAFRWSSATGPVGLSALGGPGNAIARAVSADGTYIVGHDFATNRSFRWSSTSGTEYPYEQLRAEGAFGVSGDGSIVVGFSGTSGWVWSGNSVFPLTAVGGGLGPAELAFDIAASGQAVVGMTETWDGAEGITTVRQVATRWSSSGVEALGFLPYGQISRATAVSADGSVVVGYAETLYLYDGAEGPAGFFTDEAFRWTAETGMVGLGRSDVPLENGTAGRSWALDISDDGSVVAGFASFGATNPGGGAALWIGDSGPQQVYDLLVAQGATGLDGWKLDSVEAISGDGRTIAGDGLYCTTQGCVSQGWIATLDAAAVPAPPAAWLLGTGLLGAAWRSRARGQSARS